MEAASVPNSSNAWVYMYNIIIFIRMQMVNHDIFTTRPNIRMNREFHVAQGFNAHPFPRHRNVLINIQ